MYASNSHVEALFPHVSFTGSSHVTSADLVEFLTREQEYLDARLARVYTVPITATEGQASLITIHAWLAAARVGETVYGGTGQVAAVEQFRDWRKQAKEMLKDILEANPPIWPNAARSTPDLSDYTSQQLQTTDATNVKPIFTMGETRLDDTAGVKW